MKKAIRLFIFCIMLTSFLFVFVNAEEATNIQSNGVTIVKVDENQEEGYVTIKGETTRSNIMILVVKDNKNEWYNVKLDSGKFNELVWLTKGKGTYTINIMVNEYDRQYSYGPKIEVVAENEFNQYLLPDKYIESNDQGIVEKAAVITAKAKNDIEKAKLIYNWVKSYLSYDYDKYNKHLNNNFNNEYGALLALNTKKGVCFDYSTLVAALGRATGLQVKVVKGTGKLNGFNGYHAWNEIYITEQSRWIKLDATFGDLSTRNWFDSENFDESHIAEQ